MLKEVPCTIFRGGTSKGVFFLEEFMPPQGEERDNLLLKVMGSPDIRQIDGLGGATSVTSKAAIISPSKREDADVDYTFAQVAIDKAVVDYKGNCGNISSAVGPYAIEIGMVEAKDPVTVIRIFNTNTKKIIRSYVQTPGKKVTYEGEFSIAGVPGTSSPVKIAFENPGGAVTGKILPTGNAVDVLDVPGLGKINVSIVDVTNPLVFVRAKDIGLRGTELPEELDNSGENRALLETIRGLAAQKLGFVEDFRDAATKSPAVPKMTIVEFADDYQTVYGKKIDKKNIDLLGRMMSMQKAHKTYAMTGALCTVAAAVIPGTIVNSVLRGSNDCENLRIGHPGGVIQVGVETFNNEKGDIEIPWVWGYSTARLIMKGVVYYK